MSFSVLIISVNNKLLVTSLLSVLRGCTDCSQVLLVLLIDVIEIPVMRQSDGDGGDNPCFFFQQREL